jgi:hypothetical protein
MAAYVSLKTYDSGKNWTEFLRIFTFIKYGIVHTSSLLTSAAKRLIVTKQNFS